MIIAVFQSCLFQLLLGFLDTSNFFILSVVDAMQLIFGGIIYVLLDLGFFVLDLTSPQPPSFRLVYNAQSAGLGV